MPEGSSAGSTLASATPRPPTSASSGPVARPARGCTSPPIGSSISGEATRTRGRGHRGRDGAARSVARLSPMERETRYRGIGLGLVLVVAVGTVLGTTRPWERAPTCPAFADHPDWSVARRWDEALLDAIRRSLPNPPVHARNLFHASVAMWDAWAAYDPAAAGSVFTEKPAASGVPAARPPAMHHAAD